MSIPESSQDVYKGTCTPGPLSPEHRTMLEDGSGITAAVIAARGYRTASRLADVPDCFPRWQKRLGLVVPSSSPAPNTHGYQLRPDRPRHKGPKYETPKGASITLDANPLMLEAVRSGSGELWVTEGARKVDALASWGIPAVGFTGVWNYAVPGTKGTEPLPCWRYVNLEGRTLIVAYDADARTNADVQEALRRLVTMLEKMGAIVLVIYVPAVGGDSKAGIDDFKAAGGSLENLRASARPFKPVDVAGERMSRDDKLRASVEALWAAWHEMPAHKMGQCSERAVMRELVGAAASSGKLEASPSEAHAGVRVRVIRSIRDIAKGARISLRSAKKALDRLEDGGHLRREMWGRAKDKPGAYVLLTALGTPPQEGRALGKHYGSKAAHRGRGQGEAEERDAQTFQHTYAPDDPGVYLTRASCPPSGELPVLRWPKVVHTWDRKDGRRVVVDSFYVARIGKRREEVIRHLLEEGAATVADLCAIYGAKSTRPRDFRRRMLGPLEDRGIAAVVACDVYLTPEWREALERAREEGEEPQDNRLQAEKYDRQRREFKKAAAAPKADPTPKLRGKAATRESLKRHRERWQREDAQKLRPMVEPAKAFASATLKGLEHIRLGLLEDMWRERGGQRWHLRLALRELRCKATRHAEHPGEWFVYPPSEASEVEEELPEPEHAEPAPVVQLRSPASPKAPATVRVLPEKVDGVYRHGPECSCEWCASPPAPPRYAMAGSPS